MTRTYRISAVAILIVLGLSFVLGPEPAGAQGPDVIRAEVDRSTLSTDESLLLIVTVDNAGAGASQPLLPPLTGFAVKGQRSSSQVRIVNGDMTSQDTYIYRLHPIQTGDLIIDPISIKSNGHTYTTDPITVSVTQGTKPIQAPRQRSKPNVPTQLDEDLIGQDFFIEAEVDNPTPYQGEQVVYTFRFYQAVNLIGQPNYQAPAFNGFWQEQKPEQNDYMLQAAGRTYRVSELQHVLFPTVAGDLEIEAAGLSIPGGFMSRDQQLRTRPILLDVQPLPAGAPADFRGAVGRFDIAAEVDTPQTAVDDTVTLSVTVSGRGNIGALPDPALPISTDWRAFDGETTTETWYDDGFLTGSRTTTWVLVPTTPGAITLPSLTYSFFNPATNAYETASAAPITLVVDGFAPTSSQPQSLGREPDPAPASETATLRPLKPATANLSSASAPLTQREGYWLLWLAPVALVAGQAVWQRRRRHLLATAGERRSRNAAKQAQRQIAQARRDPAGAPTADKILTTFLSDRLGLNVTGMSSDALAGLLQSRQLDAGRIERTLAILAAAEGRRYAPTRSTTRDDELLSQTANLIGDLDKALRSSIEA